MIEPTDEMVYLDTAMRDTLVAVLALVERDYDVRINRSGTASLRAVAAVYQRAEYAPTLAVADHFKVSHSTASGYLRAARRAGHLAPYRRPR